MAMMTYASNGPKKIRPPRMVLADLSKYVRVPYLLIFTWQAWQLFSALVCRARCRLLDRLCYEYRDDAIGLVLVLLVGRVCFDCDSPDALSLG